MSVVAFNLQGQTVRQILLETNLDAGVHQLVWDGRNGTVQKIVQGIDILEIKAGNQIQYTKVTRFDE